MVTGFNVDVKHAGSVFHVQTEDRGRRNPVIETLVYKGGTILHQEKISYADRNADGVYDESEIAAMLDLQHRRTIDGIKAGRFDVRRPFGEEFITNRTFDECVLDFLVEQSKNESLLLQVASHSVFVAGAPGWIQVRASDKNSADPISGVVIKSRVIRARGAPSPLPETTTDARGEARLEFLVPSEAGNSAVIVQAESEFGREELRQLLV